MNFVTSTLQENPNKINAHTHDGFNRHSEPQSVLEQPYGGHLKKAEPNNQILNKDIYDNILSPQIVSTSNQNSSIVQLGGSSSYQTPYLNNSLAKQTNDQRVGGDSDQNSGQQSGNVELSMNVSLVEQEQQQKNKNFLLRNSGNQIHQVNNPNAN